MTPAQYDFAVQPGSSGNVAAIAIQLCQIDGVTPVPVQGATVTFSAWNAAGQFLSKSTVVNGGMTLDVPSATVTYIPTAAETCSVSPGYLDEYVFRIQFADGSQGPILAGYHVGGSADAAPSAASCGCAPGSTGAPAAGAISLIKVIKVLIPGTPGPPGVAGAFQLTANSDLPAFAVVRGVGGARVDTASSDHADDADNVVGITSTAAATGTLATIVNTGRIDNPAWAWAEGPVYLGTAGALTQKQPTIGFIQQVAIAVGPTTIVVDLFPPETIMSDAFGLTIGHLPE